MGDQGRDVVYIVHCDNTLIRW